MSTQEIISNFEKATEIYKGTLDRDTQPSYAEKVVEIRFTKNDERLYCAGCWYEIGRYEVSYGDNVRFLACNKKCLQKCLQECSDLPLTKIQRLEYLYD